MQEIIKSKDVRKYLQEKNFCFTDFEKATLIYNSDWSIPEKHQALSELLEGTEDELLRVQIQERITWDNTCITKIKSMPGNVIHRFKVWEEADGKYQPAGYFASYESAERYAANCLRKCEIQVFEFEQVAEWDEEDWGDSELACVMYDEKGGITYYWGEGCLESLNKPEENRFEDAYVHIEHPFVAGDIVRVIGTDEIGVVRFYLTLEQVREIEKKSELRMNYSDANIAIEVLCEQAAFNHEHVCPLNLEYANLAGDDPRKELLECAGYLVTGQAYIQEFQMACEKYMERCKGRPQR